MSTILAIQTRRLKIKELIAMGLTPREVMAELKLSCRTYFNDLKVIRNGWLDEIQSEYGIVKMLASRDDILRGLMKKRTEAKTDQEFIEASKVANECLSDLIADLIRLGILTPKHFDSDSEKDAFNTPECKK